MLTRRRLLALALAAPFVSAPPALHALGDSIAAGYRLEPGEAFPDLLAAATGRALHNHAVGSSLAADQLERQILPLELRPPAVAVWLSGYNDMRAGTDPGAYRAVLEAGARHLTRHGARLYLGGCLRMLPAGYAAAAPRWSHGSDAAAVTLDAVARAVADAVPGCAYVPAHRAYDPANVLWDDIHPNAAGHHQIAAAFLATLQAKIWLPVVR